MTEADLPLLHEWLGRPHVAAWWDSTPTLDEVRADYLPSVTGKSSTRIYFAYMGDEPLGFIQSYVAMGSGDGWWEDVTDPGVRGIDQFLADESTLGQGLGSAMVRAFTDMLLEDPEVSLIQTDPSPTNARAIRAYQKAGFVAQREIDTPDGRELLMYRHRLSS